jgi:hypothetical protein
VLLLLPPQHRLMAQQRQRIGVLLHALQLRR